MTKRKFPDNHYFKATPENVKRFLEEFDVSGFVSPSEKNALERAREGRACELAVYKGQLGWNGPGKDGWYAENYKIPEYKFDPVFPEKHYFANTKENREKFCKKFPNETIGFRCKDDGSGFVGDFAGKGHPNVGSVFAHGSEKDFLDFGFKRFEFDPEPAEEAYPSKTYFRNTQANWDAFWKRWPNAETLFGRLRDRYGDIVVCGISGLGTTSNGSLQWFRDRGFSELSLVDSMAPAKKSLPKGGFFVINTLANRKAFFEDYDLVDLDTHEVVCEAINCGNAAEFGVVGGRLCWSSEHGYFQSWLPGFEPQLNRVLPARISGSDAYGFTKRIPNLPAGVLFCGSSTKESDMALTNDDLEKIAKMIAASKDDMPEPTDGPSLAGRVFNFSWRASKSVLGYCFAPAQKYIQHAVFLVTVAALSYGGYKGYNFVRNNIPTITIDVKHGNSASTIDNSSR